MSFGERLTQLRKENGFSTRSEFAEKLGIPSTTLRNYETDVREPGHTFLKQISEFFNVSVDYLLCLTDEKEVLNSFRLKTSEYEYIKKYRNLDNHGIQAVNSILDIEYDRCIKETEEIYYPKKYIDKLPNIASAGIGDYLLDEIPIEKIEVDNDCQADFAIGIDGDSMEPTYKHNDVVLVKRQSTINVGEIGIFIIDGECFIKEYAKDRLISHNKDYPDKIFNECMDIRLVGKVVGKLK